MGMSIFSHLYWASSFTVIFFCCVTSDVGRSRGLHRRTANNGIDVFWQLRTKSALCGSFWRKGNCLKWGNIQDHKPCHQHPAHGGAKSFAITASAWCAESPRQKKGVLGIFYPINRMPGLVLCLPSHCHFTANKPCTKCHVNLSHKLWEQRKNLPAAACALSLGIPLAPEPLDTTAKKIFKWMRKEALN